MFGYVKTFIDDRDYGFIRGEDGKSYYFKYDAIVGDVSSLAEDMSVSFIPGASPKGYFAKEIRLNDQGCSKYKTPETTLLTKNQTFKEWEILEETNWWLVGSSDNGPDAAKADLIKVATANGVNGLTNQQYFKTKGSSGNYIYTIHNFKAKAVTLARKSMDGQFDKEELLGVNASLEKTYNEQCSEAARLKRKYFKYALTATAFGLAMFFLIVFGIIPSAFGVTAVALMLASPFVLIYMLIRMANVKHPTCIIKE